MFLVSNSSFPNSSLGTPLRETPFLVRRSGALMSPREESRSRASGMCVPKPEFGNKDIDGRRSRVPMFLVPKPEFQSFPVDTMAMTFRNANTPKAFHNTAQGQRRSRATLGNGGRQPVEPCKGSTTRSLSRFSGSRFSGKLTIVQPFQGCGLIRWSPQGALTSFTTPGFDVKRLRRKELASHDI